MAVGAASARQAAAQGGLQGPSGAVAHNDHRVVHGAVQGAVHAHPGAHRQVCTAVVMGHAQVPGERQTHGIAEEQGSGRRGRGRHASEHSGRPPGVPYFASSSDSRVPQVSMSEP